MFTFQEAIGINESRGRWHSDFTVCNFFQKKKKNFICFNNIIVEGATSDFHFKF